jgi:hypothetical protein
VALRRRILDLLGAEPQWLTGDDDATEIAWKSGPAVTFFHVTAGTPDRRDVGVLRVSTPVARAGNSAAARDLCLGLNTYVTTSRWTVAPVGGGGGASPDGAEEVELGCAFVVGQDSLADLEGFALWCVREQVAYATVQMWNGLVAKEVAGRACHYQGFPGGERDDPGSWHPVTHHLQQVLVPNRDLPSDGLADELQAAFRELREAMFRGGTAAWFSAQDTPPLACEMPFSWGAYSDGVIGGQGGRGLPTALVQAMYNGHPSAGNGLLITMYIPVRPDGDIPDVVNTLNRADAEVPWATHSIGGWSLKDGTPVYVIYLPSVLARQDINIPGVMREVLLTLTRQALLARRILLPPEALEWEDKNALVGLAAPQVRHGLAWGETQVA